MLASVIVRVSGKHGHQMFCVELLEKNNSVNVTLNMLTLNMAAGPD